MLKLLVGTVVNIFHWYLQFKDENETILKGKKTQGSPAKKIMPK